MLIRFASPPDIPEILPMIAKICALHQAWDQAKYDFLPQPERLYENWVKRLIEHPRDLCLVADCEDASSPLVGVLLATVEREIPIYRLKEYAFIHDLWVEPAYRRTGIAKQLVERAIAHFTALGVSQIRLDTI